MPDPSLSEAMQEALANASTDRILIDTISIYFDGLVDDEGNPSELRLFGGENAHAVRDDGVPLLYAKIEDDAEREAGEIVEFLGVPYQLMLPPMTSQSVAAAQLSVDSVDRKAHSLLEQAALSGKQITVTLRFYIAGEEATGPTSLPPREFIMVGGSGANASIDARLVFIAIGKKPFPATTYTPERFGTLVNA